MKESYVEGLASYGGPESCVHIREGVGEALTGERAGRVSSRVIHAPRLRSRGVRGAGAEGWKVGGGEGGDPASFWGPPGGEPRPRAHGEAGGRPTMSQGRGKSD